MSPDRLAGGAKNLAVSKEAKIPSKDGAAVVAGVTIAVDATTNPDVLPISSIFSKPQYSMESSIGLWSGWFSCANLLLPQRQPVIK